MKKVSMYGGGFSLTTRSADAADILKWASLCALTNDCMAPPGSALGCRFKAGDDQWLDIITIENQSHNVPAGDRYTAYANCHRYDQSTFNVLLANKYQGKEDFYTSKTLRKFADVKRGAAGKTQSLPSCAPNSNAR